MYQFLWAIHLHRINSSSNHGTCKPAWEIEVLRISQGCKHKSIMVCHRNEMSCLLLDWWLTSNKEEKRRNNEMQVLKSCCRDFCGKATKVCSLLSMCITPITVMSGLPACPRSREASACMHGHSVVFDSFLTLWTVVHQASLSMRFSRQEY